MLLSYFSFLIQNKIEGTFISLYSEFTTVKLWVL